MKAIHYSEYGDSSVLQLTELNKPICKEDEVLVKVLAVTINPFDIKVRKGMMRQQMSIHFPYVPGTDACGVVEAIGVNVSRIKPGDKVFASASNGTYAEYAVLKENLTALKPEGISAEEAAAFVVPLNTANTVLIETAHLQKGQRVLIHGAAGAVGSVATQMAKLIGAYVIGTASGEGVNLLKELGADEVIDYKNQDFTKLVKDVDVVVDLVGGETQNRSFEVLKKGGKLLSTTAPPSQELAKKFEVTAKFVFSNPSYLKLEYGKNLIAGGKLKIRITKVLPLEKAAEAQDLLSAGGINGKIALKI